MLLKTDAERQDKVRYTQRIVCESLGVIMEQKVDLHLTHLSIDNLFYSVALQEDCFFGLLGRVVLRKKLQVI